MIKNLTKSRHHRCEFNDTLFDVVLVDLFPKSHDIRKKLTIISIVGLRSNNNERRGLMNTNDLDDDPCSAFILSIPLAPGWLVSGKRK